MNVTAAARTIQRVVVRLDAASESHTATETAAHLAARARAPLHGIFVLDPDLLSLAALPFARQVTLGAGSERLTPRDAELHLRAAAEQARRELFAAASRHRVAASFEIVRSAPDAALSGASERDLIVAAGLSRPIARHFRVEYRFWAAVEVASGPFLLARHAWTGSGSVVALLRDRGPGAARLIEAAAQIAHAADLGLTVICLPEVAGAKDLEKWIADQIADTPVRLQVEVAPAEPADLYRQIAELDCRLLAIEAGLTESGAERLRDLVERLACDVLIVR